MKKPSIIYILADDMGYGDVSCLNPDSKIKTPNIDRLGKEGIIFTDAHSSSSVCTPSRYSILTGRYCWRTYLKSHVLMGTDGPLIEPERLTVSSLLKQENYQTACIGKWHLGWDWAVKSGCQRGEDCSWIDFKRPIQNGPLSLGFDYFYGISASLDMPPYVYVENDLPVAEPTAWATAEEFSRPGPRMEGLRSNNVLGHLTNKAIDYLDKQSPAQPFFLYFPITAPHTPIAPCAEFAGKSGINKYADFCLEIDYRVGQILDMLDRKNLSENTMVIFTTDNGASARPSECSLLESKFKHYSSYIYRGYKSDIWDGGHRLPFLLRWPKEVKAGSTCDQRIGIFDLLSTVADITGQKIPENMAEDCNSFYPALKGKRIDESRREGLVHHSINGMFAIRKGKWKLCRCPGSGGWGVNDINDVEARKRKLPEVQLYDMESDPEEKNNLCEKRPAIVEELTLLLHKYVVEGRSTPGKTDNSMDISLKNWPGINWLPDIPEKFIKDD